RDFLNRLRATGCPLHEKSTVLVLDVLGRGFEKVSGQAFGFVLDLAYRRGRCRTPDSRRAAAVGTPSHRCRVGVTVNHLDVVDIDTQLAGDNLCERRLLALSGGRRANEDVDLAGWMEANNRALPQPALEPDRHGHLRRPTARDTHRRR